MFVHVVFEGFATVDEDDGDFVGELAVELIVGVDVDFLPVEASPAMEFGQRFFDDLAEVTAFAGVKDDLTRLGHAASLAERGRDYVKISTTEEHRGRSRYNPSMRKQRPLEGKVALITGGARRLGRASALALAQAGADVAITFRESGREAQHTVIDISSFGVRAVALRCDVTDEKSVKAAIRETKRELGGIDILVNNAGNYETVEFEKLTLKQWDAIFASNTRGTVPGFAGGGKAAARAARKDHQHGIAGRTASLGYARALLLLESGGPHADEGHGQGSGAGDRGELCGTGDD